VAALLWCSLIAGAELRFMRLAPHPILLSTSMLEFFLGCLGAVVIQRFRPRLSGWWLLAAILLCAAIGVFDSV